MVNIDSNKNNSKLPCLYYMLFEYVQDKAICVRVVAAECMTTLLCGSLEDQIELDTFLPYCLKVFFFVFRCIYLLRIVFYLFVY